VNVFTETSSTLKLEKPWRVSIWFNEKQKPSKDFIWNYLFV